LDDYEKLESCKWELFTVLLKHQVAVAILS